MQIPHANLVIAWIWFLLGFASGFLLGMKFHQPDWLGGYASLPRRLYRLGHISFFGLGMMNLFFWLTARAFPSENWGAAGVAFIVGAVAMPACCALMAHWPKLRLLFAIPVFSLLAAGALTLSKLL